MKFSYMTIAGKSPWQIILRGAAIPGMIVGACVIIAFIYALFDGSNIASTTKIGVGVGLFFSLLGFFEIVFGILFSSKDIKINSLLVVGYLIVWAACLYVIFF